MSLLRFGVAKYFGFFFFGITFAGSVVDLFGEKEKLDLLSVGEPL